MTQLNRGNLSQVKEPRWSLGTVGGKKEKVEMRVTLGKRLGINLTRHGVKLL